MGFPAQLDHSERNHPSNDTVSHFVLHEVQLILRLVVAASIIATVGMMVSIFYWAFVPAVILLVSYLLLMIINRFEQKAREQAIATGHSDAAGAPIESTEVKAPERDERGRIVLPFWATKREATIGWEIIIGCTVAAFVLAFALLPAEWVLLGMFFIFCYMLLVMAPVWLGWITEETDREEDELRREMRRSQKTATTR